MNSTILELEEHHHLTAKTSTIYQIKEEPSKVTSHQQSPRVAAAGTTQNADIEQQEWDHDATAELAQPETVAFEMKDIEESLSPAAEQDFEQYKLTQAVIEHMTIDIDDEKQEQEKKMSE